MPLLSIRVIAAASLVGALLGGASSGPDNGALAAPRESSAGAAMEPSVAASPTGAANITITPSNATGQAGTNPAAATSTAAVPVVALPTPQPPNTTTPPKLTQPPATTTPAAPSTTNAATTTVPKSMVAPGEYARQFPLPGGPRNALVAVPPRPPNAGTVGAVVVLHGVGARASDMRTLGFEQLASPSGAVVVYPDALDGSWNDGRSGVDHPSNTNRVDDVGFLRTLIDDLIANAGVDARRVWFVGYSNGALMTSRVACELTDRVAAVALINGPGAAELPSRCHPSAPLKVLIIHATSDPAVPYNGGTIAARDGHARGASAPVMDIFTLWARHNRCAARAEAPATNNTAITRIRATGCQRGSSVVHYRIDGGTHAWPQAPNFNAAQTIWDFYQQT